MRYNLLILLQVCLLISCEIDEYVPDLYTAKDYSFFVAGHVYSDSGIYPPFKEKFGFINNDTLIKFGIFAGDIVSDGLEEQWNSVDLDIAELEMPVYFALGNHDNKNRELFISRYGNTYYSFTYENDLFIVLDPNIDGWNISGDQLSFLIQVLNEIEPVTDNVFVFFHQLLWRTINNKYSGVLPNSYEGKSDTINFWSTVEPLFASIPNNVVMFSGDVGAANWSSDYMYDKYDNITLIASGMGEGIGDNFVIVNVTAGNPLKYSLIALNCQDIYCLGKLEDYTLP